MFDIIKSGSPILKTGELGPLLSIRIPDVIETPYLPRVYPPLPHCNLARNPSSNNSNSKLLLLINMHTNK